MGNATSLFNLMRNIGGSVGIAVATTMTARGAQKFSSVLGRHVNPTTCKVTNCSTTSAQPWWRKDRTS
jgi:hypothetical protein